LESTDKTDKRRPAVALVTCDQVPDLEEDAPLLVGALDVVGLDAPIVVWSDPVVRWDDYALVVVRGTWDYVSRREEFVAWARGLERLFNPSDVLEWNTDKRYISDLEQDGVRVVPTTFVEPGDTFDLPPGEIVVKPAVGAGGKGAGLFGPGEAEEAAAHVRDLQAAGRTVMIQPYRDKVDKASETGLIFIGNEFSHAISKGPQLRVEPRTAPDYVRAQIIEPRTPTDAERAVAEATLDAVPGGRDRLLYARIDVVPGPDGPEVLEFEATEPSLFLEHGEGSADRLARAIKDRVLPGSN
jgi:glutathione synthase/RimK-type ligase-like ATP-grasp enzyme